MDRDRVLEERLGALVGTGREDWKDVRRRARAHGYRRTHYVWIAAALATAALAVAAAPPLVAGRSVLDLFRDPDEPALPRTFVDPITRLSFDRKYGDWSLHEVADDGRTTFYSLRNADGEVVCVMQGRTDWNTAGWRQPFGVMACGNPGTMLSTARPLFYQVAIQQTLGNEPRPWRVTGVAAEGVETIVLTGGGGERMEFPVEDHAFTITEFPQRPETIQVLALDGDENVLHREPLEGFGHVPDLPPTPSPPLPSGLQRPAARPLEPGPGERPIQQARARGAEVRVYRDGFVSFRMARRSSATRLVTTNFTCLRYTEIDGETHPVWMGGSGNLAPDGTWLKARPFDPLVDPPYDGCEVHGDFGRHWNDPRGVRSPVEVPLTDRGKAYFDERAGARDLALFVRSPRISDFRRTLREDASGSLPSAGVIRRGLPGRVVALALPEAAPGSGRIGIWSEGSRLVASTQTPAGKRLFVELESGRIVRHNLGDLARLR
jgi:hypothetical protein